jgi:L-seryl-tRNA(Ser) seleniumtransferase
VNPPGAHSPKPSELRGIPAVDRVIAAIESGAARPVVVGAARAAVDNARRRARSGEGVPTLEEVVAAARSLIDDHNQALLRPVLNATGVIVHTNLGRVPLGERQLDAVVRIAAGYSNLEYDLTAGGRGNRYSHASRLLEQLTGADAALVVNNNAAAVLIVLAALCSGKEVIISRGELIEIGGEFRMPDVMAASGTRLIEVGTTNRTHIADYELAITADTAAILKVHPSNYRVVGFTAAVTARELARLARGRGVVFVHDLGSGLVESPEATPWLRQEPLVQSAIGDGADVVTFSGDKMLGGPQAGVIAGRRELIERIATHPLLRAVRPDKMTLAALEATVTAYLEGRSFDLPLWTMALAHTDDLERRARSLAAGILDVVGERGVKAEAVPTRAVAGGGSAPGSDVSSWAVWLDHPERSPAEIERALRRAETPVIGRIEDDRVLLDLRTIPSSRDAELQALVVRALGD